MVKNWQDVLITQDSSILNAMKVIDKTALQVALVVDNRLSLQGVVTDGDIRRGLINGHQLTDSVTNIMNTKPLSLPKSSSDMTRVLAVTRYPTPSNCRKWQSYRFICAAPTAEDQIQKPCFSYGRWLWQTLKTFNGQLPKTTVKNRF